MKKTIAIILLLFATTWAYPAFAQNATDSGNSEKLIKTQEEKIQELKDRLATKVAELRQNQRGAIAGTVADLTEEQLTLMTKKEEFRVAFTPDDTLIQQLDNTTVSEVAIEDLENKQYVTVFGIIDAEDQMVDAQRILIKPRIITIAGTIVEIDREAFTINAQTASNELFTIDIERTTETLVVADADIADSGFSQLATDDRVHVRAVSQNSTGKRVSATRILHLPEDIFIQTPAPEPSPEPQS